MQYKLNVISSTDKRLTRSRKLLFSMSIALFLLQTVQIATLVYSIYVLGGSVAVSVVDDVIAIFSVCITHCHHVRLLLTLYLFPGTFR